MARYGWIVNVERCSYLDAAAGGRSVFNVNLARPWSDAEVAYPDGGPELADAKAELGDLLYPWHWDYTDAGWKYFGNTAAVDTEAVWQQINDVTILPGVSQTIDPAQASTLSTAIRTEIEDAGAHCDHPFSQGLEDFWTKGSRSHVHSLAPLTHWPSLASETLLKLSFFVSIPAQQLVGSRELVCFPEFDIAPPLKCPSGTVRLVLPLVLVEEKGDGVTKGQQTEFVASYSESEIAFLGIATKIDVAQPHSAQPDFQPSQGLASRLAVRNAVWSFLLPAQILRRWLDATPFLPVDVLNGAPKFPIATLNDEAMRNAMRRLLWETLGTGSETGADGTNVLEFLVNHANGELIRKLRELLNRLTLKHDLAGTALLDAATALAADRISTDRQVWTAADVGRWSQHLDDIEKMTTKPATEAERFRTSWLSVCNVLLSDDQAPELYGPWLAFALDNVLSTPLGADWIALKSKLLTPGEIRGDHWVRARARGISDEQWKQAKLIIADEDMAHAITGLPQLVGATMNNIKVKLNHGSVDPDAAYTLLEKNGLEAFVTARVGAWHVFMTESAQRSRRRPRDRGLRFDLSAFVDPAQPQAQVQVIRGYAVALCAATQTTIKRWQPDLGRAAWLTDTALSFDDAFGKKWLESAGTTAWMHETVGATLNDGELLLSVEYEGAPLATTLSQNDRIVHELQISKTDEDGFKSVDFGWRLPPPIAPALGRGLPLLGYGLLYKAVATPIDNAGGVIDDRYRSPSGVAELIAAGKIVQFTRGASPFQYRSSEPPGSPSLIEAVDATYYELSEETQAHAYQAHLKVNEPMKVALLAHPQFAGNSLPLFPKAKAVCELHVVPPTTHFAFIERWLNTDRLLIEQNQNANLSDSELVASSSDEIAAFVEQFRERSEKVQPNARQRYHPAVTAIGVEAWSPRLGTERLRVDFERLTARPLKANQFTFSLRVQAGAAGSSFTLLRESAGAVGAVIVTLPQGEFVRIRLFSLVAGKHFAAGDDAAARFVDGIQIEKGKKGIDAFAGFDQFEAFGPAEYWFETIPEWTLGLESEPVTVNISGPQDVGSTTISPNLVTASIKFEDTRWVKWVKGVYGQRHEWHWTGYPVEFPAIDSDLNQWLPSLAGVESFRTGTDTPLTSTFDTNDQWSFSTDASKAALFYRQELPTGKRTSRYTALFVRPMLRFRRWLNTELGNKGPNVLESLIWGDGLLVAGRGQSGEAGRLPTPVLRHSIPLTATYTETSPPTREANGVALIFEEAIRRTDDLAVVGGLGDVLELDLMETRFSKIKEIGNNPIMHGKAGPWTDQRPLALKMKAPVGLTFDIGANAKVAQTAIVVQPEHGGGNWLLAKARVRRVVLPETELGTVLPLQRVPANVGANLAGYKLISRIEGDEAVLPDIAINVASLAPINVDFLVDVEGVQTKLQIVLPPRQETSLRYVLSWHKGRWGDSAALARWRCQVLVLTCTADKLTWRELDKISCHQNVAAIPLGFKSPTGWMVVNTNEAVSVRRIRLSEYTDPVWLTFIGSFGSDNLGTSSDFVFDTSNKKLLALRSTDGRGTTPPKLRGLDDTLADENHPSFHVVLVFRPINDLTRGNREPDGGMLIGTYWKRNNAFTYLPQNLGDVAPELDGCHAQVIAVQRITALAEHEKERLQKLATFSDLLEQVFPSQDTKITESLLRFLPEFLGPIPIINKNA